MPKINRSRHKRIFKALTSGFVAGRYARYKGTRVTISAHLRNRRIFLFAYNPNSMDTVTLLSVLRKDKWLECKSAIESGTYGVWACGRY